MGDLVLILRPLWPLLDRLVPLLEAQGQAVERCPAWDRLLDPLLPVEDLSAVLLGDFGRPDEEARLLSAFRARRGASAPPVVVVGGTTALRARDRLLSAGADLVLPASGDTEEAALHLLPLVRQGRRTLAASREGRRLRDACRVDPLTGLPDRERFGAELARAVELSRRTGTPVGCAVVDLDGFRGVNESHGEAAGDEVMRQVAELLDRGRRSCDTVARLGGDEFAWLLVDADGPGALTAAGRLHGRIASTVFRVAGNGPVRLTATVGVSSVPPGQEGSAELLVGNADRALYWGKESGRNVVRLYPKKAVAPCAGPS